ncbi:MAG TPA: glycosyltransferase family 9 protein, partial [Gammaproteobacteria bacterium]|nr:glycosyltransferase family 9 protein [Gammaproteobacteria bacterium]
LIGLPWARELVARLPGYVDEFLEFPGFPGLPERRCEPQAVLGFLRATQDRRFDLALQLHGSGEFSNPFVALLGARRTAGYFREGRYCPDGATFLPWRDDEPEVERGVRLLRALGVEPSGLELEAPVLPGDLRELAALAGERELPRRGYVCVHPGAQLESRRWYPERFAIVADALAARGLRIVLTGTAGEAALAGRVARRMRAPVVDLVGRTTLGGLTALVDGARLLVTNDTGVRHIAAARGTPCVAVACGSDVRRWPASSPTQRLLHADMPCRPCTHERCPIGHACAHAVESRDVLAAADELLVPALTIAGSSPCAA